MSTDFHLTCATCDPTGEDGPGRWCGLNHQGGKLLALIPKLPAIAAFYGATGFEVSHESLDVYGECPMTGLGAWAALHNGHDIRVRDEYGRWYPEDPATVEHMAKAVAAVTALFATVGISVNVHADAIGDFTRVNFSGQIVVSGLAGHRPRTAGRMTS